MRLADTVVPCLLLGFALSLPALAQQAEPEALRYKFDPPLGSDFIQSVDIKSTVITPDEEYVEHWTHDVVLNLIELTEDRLLRGTFELRNVVNVENAENDIYYLIASAIEDEPFAVVMYDFGMAAEVDWTAITARIADELPSLTSPENVAAVEAALPLFGDPTKAVLRPIDAVGMAYAIPFRADGDMSTVDELGGISYFAVEPAAIDVVGGRDGETDDYIIDWLVRPAPEVATAALGSQLRGLAGTVDGAMGTDSSGTIEAAVDLGLEAAEDGYAVYDLETSLMREATVTAVIASEPVTYGIRFKVKRQTP